MVLQLPASNGHVARLGRPDPTVYLGKRRRAIAEVEETTADDHCPKNHQDSNSPIVKRSRLAQPLTQIPPPRRSLRIQNRHEEEKEKNIYTKVALKVPTGRKDSEEGRVERRNSTSLNDRTLPQSHSQPSDRVRRGVEQRHHTTDPQSEHDSRVIREDIIQTQRPSPKPKRVVDKPSQGITANFDYVQQWLASSESPADTEGVIEVISEPITMPRKASAVVPSAESSDRNTVVSTSSKRTERSTANPYASDYHKDLKYRNVYIDKQSPPIELTQRASRIISGRRESPEMDDAAIRRIQEKSRKLRDEAEDVLITQFASQLIPAMSNLPDQRLATNSNQQWDDRVPLPLNADVLVTPLPLPKPKPDLAFGYSPSALTEKQLMTIDLLVDDQTGQSYAVPDQKLCFPFLQIEFKSQAKRGTHYVATNQAAGAGAIAISGTVELMTRIHRMSDFHYDEPQFFSVTMDHELARINVHWIKASKDDDAYVYHVEGLSKYFLDETDGIRALVRAVKNLLDWGTGERLRDLCGALDIYREQVVRIRQSANRLQEEEGHSTLVEPVEKRDRDQPGRGANDNNHPSKLHTSSDATLPPIPVVTQLISDGLDLHESQLHHEETLQQQEHLDTDTARDKKVRQQIRSRRVGRILNTQKGASTRMKTAKTTAKTRGKTTGNSIVDDQSHSYYHLGR